MEVIFGYINTELNDYILVCDLRKNNYGDYYYGFSTVYSSPYISRCIRKSR